MLKQTLSPYYIGIYFQSDSNHQTKVLYGSPQWEVSNKGW